MDEDEARRRAVERLEALIGEEEVRALMGSVPPFRWEELATKQDLRDLQADIDARFTALEHRFTVLEHRFTAMDDRFTAMDDRFTAINERLDVLQAVTQQTRTLMVAMIATIVAVGSLAVTLTQLG